VSSSLLWRTPGVIVALGICSVIACSTNGDVEEDNEQFRQDVIWCEEAASHLQECCGGTFDPHQIECRHYYRRDTGCNQDTIQRTDPAFTIDESNCLRKAACEEIVANKMCSRAQAAGLARSSNYQVNDNPSSTTSTTSTGGSSAPNAGPVCP
jgi:hypothetical protein